MTTATEMAQKWDDAIFEMIADLERRIEDHMRLPYNLQDAPKDYQLNWCKRKHAEIMQMSAHRECLIKALLKPAQYFADPAPYCELIGKRLDAARQITMEKERVEVIA